MTSPATVAVLTVSDSISAQGDDKQDKSGELAQTIATNNGFQVARKEVVSDNINEIRAHVKRWSSSADSEHVDWIITTGGTGFGVKDCTPEAISPLVEREASGLVHLMLSTSARHTPLGLLSRPVAGTIGSTLVTTLPGSPKAVSQILEGFFEQGLIHHVLDLLRGGSGKTLHSQMQGQGGSHGHHHHNHGHGHGHGHAHHHGHGHVAPKPRTNFSHDPSMPATARHRVSPYPIISLEDALQHIFNETEGLGTEKVTVDVMNSNGNASLIGSVLAEDVYAPTEVPSTKTTSVDGYALRSTDPPGVYKVLTSNTHPLNKELPQGTVFRINTGGPLPAGTDTVIMVEDTEIVSTIKDADGKDVEEDEIKTLAQVPEAENVRHPGSDVRKGDLVLAKGAVITSVGGEIGTLHFVGRKEVEVFRRPVIGVMSTGNEIDDLFNRNPEKKEEGWPEIWDTNRPSLMATASEMGFAVKDYGIVQDTIDAVVNALKSAFSTTDIVITTGGTSMGSTDLLKPVIERYFDGAIHFGRVAIKPGKPTTFASCTYADRRKYIFMLPGNPASALVTFHVFVVPALRKMSGWRHDQCQLPRIRVKLLDPMRLDPRVEFHRVTISVTRNGEFLARSTGGQRSSRMASLSRANGLVVLPQKTENGPTELAKGETADAIILGELQTEPST
ncbi:molybdenum cofactor biosynthesis protein [Coniophora puteana RWD-64-598 SS2]|uniref:Molybdenum cofactor biosynthesis protein n=1 Tax=Coniophora puteana (strain RWD-64-598) TaxID=741705 RepID=A0A5M3MB34_CONPW|nr:molybdenum cofactor biosynthesis protein [Coniophora puteana RWD-64-598 SS2]EIW76267.1 molybdenum cofactor biosynthesis protein [Coniophora puteana RWD-64-598 SS2]